MVFGLWAVVLLVAIASATTGNGQDYINRAVNYTEPLFVVVIMALASTRPDVVARRVDAAPGRLGGGTPAAWWFTILTLGPCSARSSPSRRP